MKTTNQATDKKETATPKWVSREIRRLAKMAEQGGSSSWSMFQQQASGLAAKYNAWKVYGKCSVFTGAVNQ